MPLNPAPSISLVDLRPAALVQMERQRVRDEAKAKRKACTGNSGSSSIHKEMWMISALALDGPHGRRFSARALDDETTSDLQASVQTLCMWPLSRPFQYDILICDNRDPSPSPAGDHAIPRYVHCGREHPGLVCKNYGMLTCLLRIKDVKSGLQMQGNQPQRPECTCEWDEESQRWECNPWFPCPYHPENHHPHDADAHQFWVGGTTIVRHISPCNNNDSRSPGEGMLTTFWHSGSLVHAHHMSTLFVLEVPLGFPQLPVCEESCECCDDRCCFPFGHLTSDSKHSHFCFQCLWDWLYDPPPWASTLSSINCPQILVEGHASRAPRTLVVEHASVCLARLRGRSSLIRFSEKSSEALHRFNVPGRVLHKYWARFCRPGPSLPPCGALCELCADDWIEAPCCLPSDHLVNYSYSHICFDCLRDMLYNPNQPSSVRLEHPPVSAIQHLQFCDTMFNQQLCIQSNNRVLSTACSSCLEQPTPRQRSHVYDTLVVPPHNTCPTEQASPMWLSSNHQGVRHLGGKHSEQITTLVNCFELQTTCSHHDPSRLIVANAKVWAPTYFLLSYLEGFRHHRFQHTCRSFFIAAAFNSEHHNDGFGVWSDASRSPPRLGWVVQDMESGSTWVGTARVDEKNQGPHDGAVKGTSSDIVSMELLGTHINTRATRMRRFPLRPLLVNHESKWRPVDDARQSKLNCAPHEPLLMGASHWPSDHSGNRGLVSSANAPPSTDHKDRSGA